MDTELEEEAEPEERGPLSEVARLFLHLGCVAFGGPAAHVALLEDEVVDRRRWLGRREFLDLLAATHLVPGPNSTEMVLHVGYRRAGFPGLVVAGLAFLAPAVLLTGILAWAYARWGSLPRVEPWIRGLQPAVVAVIAVAVWKLGRKALSDVRRGLVALGVAAAVLAGADPTLALLGGGLLGAGFLSLFPRGGSRSAAALVPILFLRESDGGASLAKLGLFFLKVGAVLYGSGYLLVAFLEEELVTERGWLTRAELLDAIAMGQFTPGPVLSSATFVGYLVEGVPGALVATAAIFLPSFLIVLALAPLLPRLRDSVAAARFLDAVQAAAVALMAVVALDLGRPATASPVGLGLFVLALVALVRFRQTSVRVVLAGALLGGAASLAGLG